MPPPLKQMEESLLAYVVINRKIHIKQISAHSSYSFVNTSARSDARFFPQHKQVCCCLRNFPEDFVPTYVALPHVP